jgi:hypothetical protein
MIHVLRCAFSVDRSFESVRVSGVSLNFLSVEMFVFIEKDFCYLLLIGER